MLLPELLEDIRSKLEILLMHMSYESNEALIAALREVEDIQEAING